MGRLKGSLNKKKKSVEQKKKVNLDKLYEDSIADSDDDVEIDIEEEQDEIPEVKPGRITSPKTSLKPIKHGRPAMQSPGNSKMKELQDKIDYINQQLMEIELKRKQEQLKSTLPEELVLTTRELSTPSSERVSEPVVSSFATGTPQDIKYQEPIVIVPPKIQQPVQSPVNPIPIPVPKKGGKVRMYTMRSRLAWYLSCCILFSVLAILTMMVKYVSGFGFFMFFFSPILSLIIVLSIAEFEPEVSYEQAYYNIFNGKSLDMRDKNSAGKTNVEKVR